MAAPVAPLDVETWPTRRMPTCICTDVGFDPDVTMVVRHALEAGMGYEPTLIEPRPSVPGSATVEDTRARSRL